MSSHDQKIKIIPAADALIPCDGWAGDMGLWGRVTTLQAASAAQCVLDALYSGGIVEHNGSRWTCHIPMDYGYVSCSVPDAVIDCLIFERRIQVFGRMAYLSCDSR